MDDIIEILKFWLRKSLFAFSRFLRLLAKKVEKRKTVLSKLPGNRTARLLINRYKLVFAVGTAIIICLLLTVFSMLLYVLTGTSKLDLSRPGYEEVRQKVTKKSPSERNFEPRGTLDDKIISDYLNKYQEQSRALSKYDTFNPKLLEEVMLGLNSNVAAPSDGANP